MVLWEWIFDLDYESPQVQVIRMDSKQVISLKNNSYSFFEALLKPQ